MNDLVERLRNSYISHGLNYVQEAADEIESLRNRLHELSLSWQGQNAEIERLEKRLGQEKERADYAWKNTRTLDKVRMEAEAERDAYKKDAAALWMMLDDIIHMAEQAGIPPAKITSTTPVQYPTSEGLARFARLVAAREREYCWHTCDKLIMYGLVTEAQQRYNQAYGHCKDAIRARGEK